MTELVAFSAKGNMRSYQILKMSSSGEITQWRAAEEKKRATMSPSCMEALNYGLFYKIKTPKTLIVNNIWRY
jgi:hypothetical protein